MFIKTDTRFGEANCSPCMRVWAKAARKAVRLLRDGSDSLPLVLTSPASVSWRCGWMSERIDVTAGNVPVWALDGDVGHTLITTVTDTPRVSNTTTLFSQERLRTKLWAARWRQDG